MSTAFQWIDTSHGLEQARSALESAPRLYLDTEFESNRNGTRLCVLQVSSGSSIFLIDTLTLRDLRPLRPVFERAETEWVLHAGVQDTYLIAERFELNGLPRLFDTQVAWALLTAENCVSLAYLQFQLLGLRSNKAHQADDWLRRPLPESQLRYAAADVAHLPSLVEQLAERAERKQRLELIYTASHETLTPSRESNPQLKLDSFRNAWQLEATQQAGLRALIDWYNALSREEKQRVPETKTLLSIASRLPENLDELSRIKGVTRDFLKQHGKALIAELSRAARTATGTEFVPIDPPPYATFAETRLEAWLMQLRAEICAELEVSPEFVLPARIQKELKHELLERGPRHLTDALSGFRRELLGEAISRFCDKHPPPR